MAQITDPKAIIDTFTVHMQEMTSAIVVAVDSFKVLSVSAGNLVSTFNSLAFTLSQITSYEKVFSEQLRGLSSALGRTKNGLWGMNKDLLRTIDTFFVFTKQLGTLGLVAAAASEHFLNMASPDLASTLKGSFSLLAGQIGLILLPRIISLVAAVQDLWLWLKNASPAVRNIISGVFSLFASFLILRAGLAVLAFVLSPAVTGFRLLAAILPYLWTQISTAAGKLTFFSALLGAAVFALGFFIGSLHREADRINRHTERDNQWTQAEMEELSELKKQSDQIKDPQERIKFLQEELKRRMSEEKSYTDQEDKSGMRVPGLFGQSKLPPAIDYEKRSDLERKVLEARQLLENERRAQAGLAPAYPTNERSKKQESARRQSYLFDTVTTSQPVFSQISDVYRKIQLSALGPSPLEQAQKQMHREAMVEMIKQLRALEGIERNTKQKGVGP